MTRSGTFGPIHPTRYRDLGYQMQGHGNWRLLDMTDDRVEGTPVGPLYRTRAELLADLDRWVTAVGWV